MLEKLYTLHGKSQCLFGNTIPLFKAAEAKRKYVCIGGVICRRAYDSGELLLLGIELLWVC